MHNNMLLEEEVGISCKVVSKIFIANNTGKERSASYVYHLNELEIDLSLEVELIFNKESHAGYLY